jgi:hypothetical protein
MTGNLVLYKSKILENEILENKILENEILENEKNNFKNLFFRKLLDYQGRHFGKK